MMFFSRAAIMSIEEEAIMPKVGFMTLSLLLALILSGCSHVEKPGETQTQRVVPLTGEVRVLQDWQGDYPVVRLDQLPEQQREQGVGFISDPVTFKSVWQVFQPGAGLPGIDFENRLVFFARNTQFYNRIRIGKIHVKEGVAQVLAMETMSARPIEDKVAMSLVVVARAGLTGIQVGAGSIPID
jgi:hypothetical protein